MKNVVMPPVVCVLITETRPVSSGGDSGTWEPRAVVSMTAINRLVMGSTAERSAWGITILRRICVKVRPRERAASICPTPMVLMPLMKFSEPKAEPSRIVVTMTQVR